VTLKPVENRRVLLEVLRIDVLARNPSSVGQIVFERAFTSSIDWWRSFDVDESGSILDG